MMVPMERDRTIAESRSAAELGTPPGASSDNRRAVYQELCISYRFIDDFRAKLLGYLPLASASGIFLLLGPFAKNAAQYLLPIGLFGVAITLGLFSYELYGIKKCHSLIQVGRQLERSLLVDGQFINQPQNLAGIVNEPFAAGV